MLVPRHQELGVGMNVWDEEWGRSSNFWLVEVFLNIDLKFFRELTGPSDIRLQVFLENLMNLNLNSITLKLVHLELLTFNFYVVLLIIFSCNDG